MSESSIFQRVMGRDYDRLPLAVRRFHGCSGHRVFTGQVQTHAPTTLLAKLLARCVGAPRRERVGPIRFELDATPAVETWVRHFPGKTMRSRFRQVGGLVEERLGAVTLEFRLVVSDGALALDLHSMRFLGLRCPRSLLPSVRALERGDEQRLYFDVSAALPILGLVAHYSGHLEVAAEFES